MLTKKQQQQYLDEKNGEWQEHLQTFADSQSPESLHQLRVAIKKIRALARFSKACSGRKAISDFNGLKTMFRQAGIIRDAGKTQQLHLQTTETERFVQHIKQYRRQGKRAGKRLHSVIRSVPAGCIRDWYALQLVSTGILLTSSGDDLHKARKQIKDLLYMEKLLPPPVQKELNLDRNYLDQLQEAIGQWHDDIIAAVDASEKEAAVRRLAENFYLRINRS